MTERPVAAVTGGTSGIGLALCVALAHRDYTVITIGREDARCAAALAEIRAARDGEHMALALDVSKPSDMERLGEECTRRFGRVDVLVNNAGIQHVAKVEDFPVERWDAIIAINLTSAFHTTRLAIPSMRAANWRSLSVSPN